MATVSRHDALKDFASTMKQPTPLNDGGSRRTRSWRLTRPWRQFWLIAHVLLSIGWFGLEGCFLLLGLIANTTEIEVLHGAYFSIGVLSSWFVPIASLGALVTGFVLSLGTVWGLVRYTWVVLKLLATLVMILVGNLILINVFAEASAQSMTMTDVSGQPAQ
jgi:hypothetical protein